jgi:hypothetical protein
MIDWNHDIPSFLCHAFTIISGNKKTSTFDSRAGFIGVEMQGSLSVISTARGLFTGIILQLPPCS